MILPLLLQTAMPMPEAPPCPADLVCATTLDRVRILLAGERVTMARSRTREGLDQLDVKDGSVDYHVIAAGCDQPAGCDTLTFQARYVAQPGFGATFANRWNRSWSFVSMVNLPDGRMQLNMDVLMPGGIPKEQMAAWITVWRSSLNALGKFYDADVKANPPPSGK